MKMPYKTKHITGTPTPHAPLVSDDDVLEGPQSGLGTPQETESQDQGEEPLEEDEDEDDPGTPANASEALSHTSTPARGQSSIPRKRRAGRPPKGRSHDWDGPDDLDSRDVGSDIGTPRKRGGWRGRGFGAGRWGKPRGGPSHVTQVPVDKEGNMANVKDDEVELPEDPEGETKVDKMGKLLGDREYRVRVFTISGKGDRLYMLSTEPARCIGFRDSYLFFQKHKQLYKIILAEEAKRDLIERSIIPHSYKGRAIGVVTARSVFREFGARIIIGGKKIFDDYQVAAARAHGDVEGEFAVPDDKVPGGGDSYDRNRYVAWHGASSVYHSGAPSVPLPNGKVADGKKRKVIVTGVNWMFEHAREARSGQFQHNLFFLSLIFLGSRFNNALTHSRRQNLGGIYDIHTNVMQYPKIMQPSHAFWEQLSTPSGSPKFLRTLSNQGRENLGQENSLELQDGDSDDYNIRLAETIFSGVVPVLARNFLITDTCFLGPLRSGLGLPGPDEEILDIGPGGLTHVAKNVVAELPDYCQRAFNEAQAEEIKWKITWGREEVDGARGHLRISYNN